MHIIWLQAISIFRVTLCNASGNAPVRGAERTVGRYGYVLGGTELHQLLLRQVRVALNLRENNSTPPII